MESEKDAWDILTRWTGTNTGLFEKLRAAGHERTLTAGHILMAEGEAPKGVFLILSGSISVVVYSSNGHEVHLSTLSAGDWVGEMAVLSGGPRSAYAVAAETSRRMFEFAAFSSYGRIYAEVIRRSKPGPDTEERHVSPAPSITELAAQLSVARETASRAISRLERMHLLARETKHWRVLAPEKLANLID
jgi:CRP-like cAMP-binding protein